MRKLITALLIVLIVFTTGSAQQNKWYIAPDVANMGTTPVAITSGSHTPNSLTHNNALFDAVGTLIFSVEKDKVYDSNHNLIGSLGALWDPTANHSNLCTNVGSTEVAIVPVPGVSNAYYIIYEGIGTSGKVWPLYTKVVINGTNCASLVYNPSFPNNSIGTIIEGDATFGDLLGTLHIGVAVGTELNNGNPYRRLYLVGETYVGMCTITAAGISQATAVIRFTDIGGNNNPRRTVEADLSPNGRFLCWSKNWTYLSASGGEVSKIELNLSTGLYVNGTGITYTCNDPSGVEFLPVAKGGTMLYYLDNQNIYRVNAATNFIPVSINNSPLCANTHLERAKNGKIYGLAYSDCGNSLATCFFSINTQDQVVNESAMNFHPYYYFAPLHYSGAFALPDQIDGENYSGSPYNLVGQMVNMSILLNDNIISNPGSCASPINVSYAGQLLFEVIFPNSANPLEERFDIVELNQSTCTALSGGFQRTGTWTNFDNTAKDLKMLIGSTGLSLGMKPGLYKITYRAKYCSTDMNSKDMYFNLLPPTTNDFVSVAAPNSALLHNRFEFKLSIPGSINTKIQNYLNDYTNHLRTTGQNSINPYNPEEIKIEAAFTGPDLITRIRHGFYYREVIPAAYSGQYPNASFSQGLTTLYAIDYSDHPFRVRIAPEVTGDWQVTVKLILNNQVVVINKFAFTVWQSNKTGALQLYTAPNGSRRYFKDSNGNDFFILGQNMVPGYDPYSKNQPTANGAAGWSRSCPNQIPEYPTYISSPALCDRIRDEVISIKNNNGNFIRVRMDDPMYGIEACWKQGDVKIQTSILPNTYKGENPNEYKPLANCLGDYDHRQNHAWELDRLLAVCEANNIYMVLNLFDDISFWDRADTYSSREEIVKEWHKNPYGSIYENPDFIAQYNNVNRPGVQSDYSTQHYKNGQGVLDFFHDNKANMPANPAANYAFKKIQHRLFYVNARYGYSPNIAFWEIMNETDQLAMFPNSQLALTPQTNLFVSNAPFRNSVLRWILDVNNELKSFYPKKLVMNGMGWTKKDSQEVYHNYYNGLTPAQNGNPEGYDYIDIASTNFYQYNIKDIGYYYPNYPNLENGAPNTEIYKNHGGITPAQNQPFLVGESGYGEALTHIADDNTHQHAIAWASCFSGQLGASLQFWDPLNNGNYKSNYTGMYSFFSQVPLNNNEWFSYMEKTTGGAVGNSSKIIYNYYMTNNSSNASLAIGWINNYSYNFRARQLRGDYNTSNIPEFQCWVLNQNYLSPTANSFITYPENINNYSSSAYPAMTEGEIGSVQNRGPYSINTAGNEVAVKIEHLIPNQFYRIELYDPYSGNNIQNLSNIYQSNSSGVIYIYPKLYANRDYITKAYPDYAFKAILIGSRLANGQQTTTESVKGEDQNITLFPNPGSGSFTVTFAGISKEEVVKISIYNAQGKIIQNEKQVIAAMPYEFSIDQPVPGIYFIQIVTQSGQKITKRFVII